MSADRGFGGTRRPDRDGPAAETFQVCDLKGWNERLRIRVVRRRVGVKEIEIGKEIADVFGGSDQRIIGSGDRLNDADAFTPERVVFNQVQAGIGIAAEVRRREVIREEITRREVTSGRGAGPGFAAEV
jgi:hypothetical protein